MNKTILLVIALVVILGAIFVVYQKAEAPTDGPQTGTPPPPPPPPPGGNAHDAAAKANLIVVDAPLSGSKVVAPLTVSGKARGTWYFEASFPIKLVTDSGAILFEGPAQAEGEWMTENFVPFKVVLTFPMQPAGSKGKLILTKDNPSGLPQYDDYLEIPVTF